MKKFLAGLFVVFMGALFGCGGSGSGSSGAGGSGNTGSIIDATSIKFTSAMISGNTYAFDLILSNGTHINPETITFKSDGTGTSSGSDNGAVTWSIDSSGRLIIVNPSTSLTISAAITDDSNPSVIKVNLYEFNASKTINTMVTATMTLTGSGTVFTAAMVSGKTLSYTNVAQNNNGVVLTFNANGDVIYSGSKAGSWSIDASGKLVMTITSTGNVHTMTLVNATSSVINATEMITNATIPGNNTGPDAMTLTSVN